ncbi:MAG: NAD(P)H-binding protein [Solirubrobacteraceae bacterium]
MAGGSGVIGVRLVPLLVGEGHDVAAMTRSSMKAPLLQALGAVPVVCDVFDARSLTREVSDFAPHVLIQLTACPTSQR